jgi:hypothetical protein
MYGMLLKFTESYLIHPSIETLCTGSSIALGLPIRPGAASSGDSPHLLQKIQRYSGIDSNKGYTRRRYYFCLQCKQLITYLFDEIPFIISWGVIPAPVKRKTVKNK